MIEFVLILNIPSGLEEQYPHAIFIFPQVCWGFCYRDLNGKDDKRQGLCVKSAYKNIFPPSPKGGDVLIVDTVKEFEW